MKTKLQELQSLKKIFWYFVLAIFVMIVLYFYFVNKTVYNVAERENIRAEIAKLNTELGELEFKSISIKNQISPEYAYSLGFKEVGKQQFIQRSPSSGISMRGN